MQLIEGTCSTHAFCFTPLSVFYALSQSQDLELSQPFLDHYFKPRGVYGIFYPKEPKPATTCIKRENRRNQRRVTSYFKLRRPRPIQQPRGNSAPR